MAFEVSLMLSYRKLDIEQSATLTWTKRNSISFDDNSDGDALTTELTTLATTTTTKNDEIVIKFNIN